MAQHKIDINNASKEEIMTVSGIGNEVAEAIVRYRQEHGKFKTVNDLQNIPGIREKGFQRLEDDFTTTEDTQRARRATEEKSPRPVR